MRQLVLVWSRVKQYAQTNPLAFVFYLFGSVVCGLLLIYIYGNTIPALMVIDGDNHWYRSYSIYLEEDQSFDTDVLEEMAENWPFTGDVQEPFIMLQKGMDKDDYPDVNFVGYEYVTPMVEAEYNNQIDLFPVQGRVRFEESDLEAVDSPIILPAILPVKDFDSKVFHIGNRPYAVIGLYSGVSSVVIPVQDFLQLTDQPDFIVVRLAEINNDIKMRNQITAYLQQYYPDSFIHPPFYNGLNPAETNIMAALLGILYALALSSITFISKYLFEQNRSANGIYRLAGCSKRQLAGINMLENVLLAFITLVIDIGLHRLLYKSVFVHLNLTPDIVYTAADYLRLALIIVVVTMFLFRFNQRNLFRRPVAENLL